ncbi:MAG: hydroxymethylbilane synthase [Thermoguttaceae bacterium]|jgi:hydroxymethylbilane synthase
MHLRLGTRGSALARRQADWVAGELRAAGVEVELAPITTGGDRHQGPIQDIGQGVFTKEIQRALMDKRIDLAVHSLKDLPTDTPPELILAAMPRRAPCGDVLVSPAWKTLEQLPAGATVGTSSMRRRAQILHVRPDLQTKEIRGNIDTRLRKLHENQYDALMLAEAGLARLGLAGEITQFMPMSMMLPAVGQGALGLESRRDDEATRTVLAALDHPPTHHAVLAERAMLAALHGGCLTPIAAWGRVENGRLVLTGRVLSPDGRRKIEAVGDAELQDSVDLGRRVAEKLLQQGAAELIKLAR